MGYEVCVEYLMIGKCCGCKKNNVLYNLYMTNLTESFSHDLKFKYICKSCSKNKITLFCNFDYIDDLFDIDHTK